VVNRQDENLGNIHEPMIDAEDGRLLYVVLSIGGFMGFLGHTLGRKHLQLLPLLNQEGEKK